MTPCLIAEHPLFGWLENIIAFPLLNPHLRWLHPMFILCSSPCFVLFDARFLLTLLAPLIHRFLTASNLFPPNGGGPKKIGVPINSFYTIQKFTIWVWVNTYRYIFSGMNIHLPTILGFTRYQGFDPSPFHLFHPMALSGTLKRQRI